VSGNTVELRILWGEETADSCFPSGGGKGKILVKICHQRYHHVILLILLLLLLFNCN
jgi:hypothetical protein